jgi:phosphatidylglycerophosphate synthase
VQLNLPNVITLSRIAATPLIATLVFSTGWIPRLTAWVLFIAAAVTDYWDGKLARDRGLVTDAGKHLDPLADKLLLLATLLPMYWLTRNVDFLTSMPSSYAWAAGSTIGPVAAGDGVSYPFVTPIGLVGLPFWIVGIVLGREIFMTLFRQYAARKGVTIAAIGPAKWKTGFQLTWVGAAFFWFFASDAAAEHRWTHGAWQAFAWFNGIVGVVSMTGAVLLTLYSLWLYMQRYGGLLRPRSA